MHHIGLFQELSRHPLIDIQQHTYSHALFKPDTWKGGVFLASPPEAIETELAMTSAPSSGISVLNASACARPTAITWG